MLSVWLQNVSSHWHWCLRHRCYLQRHRWWFGGGTDPEDIVLASCLLGLLCRDSAPFSVTFSKEADSSRILFFFSWVPLHLFVLHLRNISACPKLNCTFPVRDEIQGFSIHRWKKEKRKTAGVHVVWVKQQPSCEGEALKSKEEADLFLREVRRVMEFLFLLLRPLFSLYGGTKELEGVEIVHSSFLWRSYFGRGEEKGVGWPTLHFPLFFTLFGKRLEKAPVIYIN